MKPLAITVGLMAASCLVVALWSQARMSAGAPASSSPLRPTMAEPEKHKVTPDRLERSGRHSGRAIPAGLAADDAAGTAFDLDSLTTEGRPLVVIFIKDGCPCSTSAEPFFRRLHFAYGDRATFLGVIDGGPSSARRWADDHHTPFPVLADPGTAWARAFGAESSAYVAVVAPGGQVEALWPGYSAPMLVELGATIARLAGVAPVPVEAADAPAELYTGCPFEGAAVVGE